MLLSNRIEAFRQLGHVLRSLVGENTKNGILTDLIKKYEPIFSHAIRQQYAENKWFLPEFCQNAISALGKMLNEEDLSRFESEYRMMAEEAVVPQTVAVISAGNIPIVAFHDFMMVLLSGNRYMGKLSSQDKLLLPVISQLLIDIEPQFANYIVFVNRISDFDKVIATGSDNTSRYFEYYFGKYPHIVRHSRNSFAILDGNETETDLSQLCQDIFLYFGLGCRSVSKIYVPENYNFDTLINCMNEHREPIKMHHAYLNNLDYQRTMYMMNLIPFIDAQVALLAENSAIASPIGIVYYQYYQHLSEIHHYYEANRNHIQCVATSLKTDFPTVSFGQTQQPSLFDFADGVNTFRFCIGK